MAEIQLQDSVKQDVVARLQKYFSDELQQELGSFDAQFLLDFFTQQVGCYYYNQGLSDALQAFEGKIEEFNDIIYQLEQEPPEN